MSLNDDLACAKIDDNMTHRKSGLEMPNDLVFVRHGESEANIIQEAEKMGEIALCHQEIAARPDWQQRLTDLGVKQAGLARDWLDFELGGASSFDANFVSPFLRTRETASYLGGEWVIDDRTIERYFGGLGTWSHNTDLSEDDLKTLNASPWYARIDSAESMQDVFWRYRSFQDSLRRNHSGQRVLVVSHGNFIKAACYAIEWLLPEDWMKPGVKERYKLPNGGIVQYSRVNPFNPSEISKSMRWRRIVNPADLKNSPHQGQWVELNIKRTYSATELASELDDYPPYLRSSQ